MSIESRLEKEEDAIAQAFEDGDISAEEYKVEMNELHRDYQESAKESAQCAYNDEMDRW